jgi:hypothetical protein
MRSRLEAKWAAFFDQLGWRWQYEPTEFPGWIPDFALFGRKGNVVYVEVKPVGHFPSEVAGELNHAMRDEDKSIELLILGLMPNFTYDTGGRSRATVSNSPPLGWLYETYGTNITPPECSWMGETWGGWVDADFHVLGGWGFHSVIGEWFNRITGSYDGTRGAWVVQKKQFPDHLAALQIFWNRACNSQQWRSVL